MTSRREERRSAKRESILEAAAAVFAEEGFDVASMDRVAERAGASKRTVYNHFGSKDALFEAVIGAIVEAQLAAKKIPFSEDRPLAEQLAEFARAKSQTDPQTLALMRTVLAASIHDPSVMSGFNARFESEEDALEEWFKAAHQAGRLHVPNPAITAALFWATAGGALFWPVAVGLVDEVPTDVLIPEMVGLFLERHAPIDRDDE